MSSSFHDSVTALLRYLFLATYCYIRSLPPSLHFLPLVPSSHSLPPLPPQGPTHL